MIKKCTACQSDILYSREENGKLFGVKNTSRIKGVVINGKYYHYRKECKRKANG